MLLLLLLLLFYSSFYCLFVDCLLLSVSHFLAALASFINQRDCAVVITAAKEFLEMLGMQNASPELTFDVYFNKYNFTDLYLAKLKEIKHPVLGFRLYQTLNECANNLKHGRAKLGDFKVPEESDDLFVYTDFWRNVQGNSRPFGVFHDLVKPVRIFRIYGGKP